MLRRINRLSLWPYARTCYYCAIFAVHLFRICFFVFFTLFEWFNGYEVPVAFSYHKSFWDVRVWIIHINKKWVSSISKTRQVCLKIWTQIIVSNLNHKYLLEQFHSWIRLSARLCKGQDLYFLLAVKVLCTMHNQRLVI